MLVMLNLYLLYDVNITSTYIMIQVKIYSNIREFYFQKPFNLVLKSFNNTKLKYC